MHIINMKNSIDDNVANGLNRPHEETAAFNHLVDISTTVLQYVY